MTKLKESYIKEMETLLNEFKKNIKSKDLEKAKEKNKEISDLFTEIIIWSLNNNFEDEIPLLELLQNNTESFLNTIIKLLENNANIDEAKITLKETGFILKKNSLNKLNPNI